MPCRRLFVALGKGRHVRFNWTSSPPRATLLLVVLMTSLSGCALVTYPQTGSGPVIEPQLPPDVKPRPAPTVEPPVAAPAPPPARPPEAPPESPPTPPAVVAEDHRVAVLLSDRTPAFESVANALATRLDLVDIYDLSDKSLTPREIFDAVHAADTDVVVAVGLRATSFARSFEELPVVFSQVFNVDEVDLTVPNVKGVSVLPPLDLQLDAWLELNPNLSSVGAIVGPGHEHLVQEATAAAAEGGVRFQHRVAESDRETLYLFTRLVPDIDGFWLFPDNRVLSADILRQMLEYAKRHRVQVAVFNDALLPLGATISVTSVDDDIAATVIEVAQKLLEGFAEEIPDLSPLSEVRVATPNGAVERVAGDVRDSIETSR